MTYPTISPSLTLDFAKSKQLDPRIAFTRSSTGTYLDAAIGLIKTAPSGVARFEKEGLLTEESRTNLVRTSTPTGSGLSNGWSQRANTTITTNADVAPDGTTTATSVVANLNSTDYAYTRHTLSSATTANCVVSAFAKPINNFPRTVIQVSNSGGGSIVWNFNFQTGVATLNFETGAASNFGSTAFMEPLDNGWYRVGFTAPSGTSNITVNARETWSGSQPAGDGVSGVLWWGCQIEEGSFQTSFIPTSGSTVTRAADVTSISNAEMLKVVNLEGNACLMTTHWNTFGANKEYFFLDSTGYLQARQWRATKMRAGGINATGYTPITGQETYNTVFQSRDGNTVSVGNNAGCFASGTQSVTLPGTGTFQFGKFSNSQLKQVISRIVYYPQTLTQAELETTSEAMTSA